MPALEVRPLQPDDLPALMAVQRAAYGDGFMESTEVFARRLASPVNCSLALLLDGALCAYLAAYQSVQGKVTPLHGDFEPPVGTAPDTLYLHDMAVPAPVGAGRGAGPAAECAGVGAGVRRLLAAAWLCGAAAAPA